MNAQDQIARLRSALFGLVGVETTEELQAMIGALQQMPVPDAERVAMYNAIHALLETDPAKEAERRRVILESANEEYRALVEEHGTLDGLREEGAAAFVTAPAYDANAARDVDVIATLQRLIGEGCVIILRPAEELPETE